jgi:hypothetical protein
MNPGRQTTIIDDFSAVEIAQQGQRRAPKKSKADRSRPSATQNASSPKPKAPKKPKATKDTGPRFYEGNGVKIPLYDEAGKKRAHARLAKTLRNKNTDFLLDTAEQYAGKAKRREFEKANKTKAEIADWIEEMETIALGPNPKSALKGESGQRPRMLCARKLIGVDLNIEDEEALWVQPKDQDKGNGKRKRDCTPEPAHDPQQTIKKPRIHNTDAEPLEAPILDMVQVQAKASDERPKSMIDEQKLDELPRLSSDISMSPAEEAEKQLEAARQVDLLHDFMGDIGIHPENPDASSFLVQLPEETRVLTAVTNANTGQLTLHDTPIPRDHSRTMGHQPQPSQQPHLKPGMHGRNGDFQNDPDRRTGRGHEVSSEDHIALSRYMSFRGQVLRIHPRFPAAGAGQEIEPTVRESWDDNERWYNGFTQRYPGFSVGHLWPCGCEKLRDEGEDSESEEE